MICFGLFWVWVCLILWSAVQVGCVGVGWLALSFVVACLFWYYCIFAWVFGLCVYALSVLRLMVVWIVCALGFGGLLVFLLMLVVWWFVCMICLCLFNSHLMLFVG